MCISPINIPRKGGSGSKDRIDVPCGVCYECLSAKRNDWSLRLKEEMKVSSSSFFVTLTYNDDNYRMQLEKRDIQLFIKRLRETENFRYFCCGEYGARTLRPHYHLIMFFSYKISDDRLCKSIDDKWSKGFVKVAKCNEATIHYTTKYVLKSIDFEGSTFTLMSRKPGIGSGYLTRKNISHHRDSETMYKVQEGGMKQRLPRYYRDKIFDKEKRKEVIEELNRVRERLNAAKQQEFTDKGENYFINDLNLKKHGIERRGYQKSKGETL